MNEQAKNMFELLFESVPDGLLIVNEKGRVIMANEQAAQMFGYSRPELSLLPLETLMPERYRASHIKYRSAFFEAPKARVMGAGMELFGLNKNNNEFPVDIALGTIQMNGSNHVLVIIRETAHLKSKDEALRKSEQRLAGILNSQETLIVRVTPQNIITYMNEAYERAYGLKIGDTFWVKVHPDDEVKTSEALERLLAPPYTCCVEQRSLIHGEWRTIFWQDSVVHDAEGNIVEIQGVGFDVTDRNKAEAAVRESEQKYRSFFDEDLTGDFIVTLAGQVLACNPAYERIFGFSSLEEALGVNIVDLFSSPEEYKSLTSRVYHEKKLEYIEIEMKHRDGKPLNIVANIFGKFDGSGQLIEIKGYLFDDTRRRKLERQLQQAQKLDSVGTLAGGIAHDFNNILAIILGHATLMERTRDDAMKWEQSREAIVKASQRGASLVKQLLTFARKTEAKFQPVQFNELIIEHSKLLYETFPKSISVSTSLQTKLPLVTGDITQLYQVLLNLSVNSRDAMPKGGTLSLITEVVDGVQVRAQFHEAKAEKYVKIQVRDTGIGMDETTLHRIFEPFFTTKEVGQGTGLGLAVVFGIVHDHGGYLDVKSKPGKGTDVSMYLPTANCMPEQNTDQEKSLEELPQGCGTILFVEDEEMLNNLVSTVLLSKGYAVIPAYNGIEGFEIFLKRSKEIDVVLTDIGLPLLSGDELYYKIREVDSQQRVILASGYIDPKTKSSLEQSGAKHFLQKPYSYMEILEKIREVRDGL
ncbi:MAG: PAS domain-containing sensor histidine kinase [Bacteroidetes bacterium]|nr:MAG: PAS domain-containing sensor histidine kinase [Bacteroidota bacterium]